MGDFLADIFGSGENRQGTSGPMGGLMSELFPYQPGPYLSAMLMSGAFGLSGPEGANKKIAKQLETALRNQGVDIPKGAFDPKFRERQRGKSEKTAAKLAKIEEGGVSEKEQKKYAALQSKQQGYEDFLASPATWAQASPQGQEVLDVIQNPYQPSGVESYALNQLGIGPTTPPAGGTPAPGAAPQSTIPGLAADEGMSAVGPPPTMSIDPQAVYERSMQDLYNAQGYAQELADTGFTTDVTPIQEDMQRRFAREYLPQLAERFPGLGGIQSSGPGQLGAGAGKDLFSALGALDAQYQEYGNQRRAMGTQMLPQFATLPTVFQHETLGSFMDLGQQGRGQLEGARPGFRFMEMLAGMQPNASQLTIPMGVNMGDAGGGFGNALASMAGPIGMGMGGAGIKIPGLG